jgi:membrane protease YdiL (CAAX protease family)
VNESERSPRQAALPALVTAVAVGVLAAFVTVGGGAQMLNLAWGLWVTEILIFLGLPWAAVSSWGVDARRMSGADSGSTRSLAIGFALGALNYFAWAVPLMAAAQAVFPAKVVKLFASSTLFEHQTPLETAVLVAGVGLAAPVCEEFLFRGVLLRGLMERFPPPTAVVITALMFAGFHLDPVGFLARFEMGVLFGLLAWRAGSLWPSAAAHAANNLVSSAIYFAAGADAEAEAPVWLPLTSLLVGNAALLLIARLARGKLRVPQPAAIVIGPPRPFLHLLAPWVLGGAVLLAGLLAVDLRGVKLGLFDATHPLPSEVRKNSALWELRAKARGGEVELQQYEAFRLSLADGGPSSSLDGGATGALR